MARQIIMKSITLQSGQWFRLADFRTIADVYIINMGSSPGNEMSMRVRGEDGVQVPGGIQIRMEDIDLSEIEVQGNYSQNVVVVGTMK